MNLESWPCLIPRVLNLVRAQVVCGLRLRCIVVAKFSRWRRRVEKMSKFCPSFREGLALTCAVFLASSEITLT